MKKKSFKGCDVPPLTLQHYRNYVTILKSSYFDHDILFMCYHVTLTWHCIVWYMRDLLFRMNICLQFSEWRLYFIWSKKPWKSLRSKHCFYSWNILHITCGLYSNSIVFDQYNAEQMELFKTQAFSFSRHTSQAN